MVYIIYHIYFIETPTSGNILPQAINAGVLVVVALACLIIELFVIAGRATKWQVFYLFEFHSDLL